MPADSISRTCLGIDTLVFGDDQFARLYRRYRNAQLRHADVRKRIPFLRLRYAKRSYRRRRIGQDLFVGHADRTQQDRDWHLTTTVNTEEQISFGSNSETNHEPR